MLRVNVKAFVFVFCAFAVLIGAFGYAEARRAWRVYKADSGILSVKLPEEPERTAAALITAQTEYGTTGAHSESLRAQTDDRPFVNSVKHYIVTLDHTLGPSFTPLQIKALRKRSVENFINHYRKKDALLLGTRAFSRDLIAFDEIQMVYTDEELGPQGVRARIGFGETLKVQQVFTGPDDVMDAALTNQFFDSLFVKDGLSRTAVPIKEAWVKHISPLELFSVWLPPPSAPFVAGEPTVEFSDTTERVSLEVFDPIRLEKVNYTFHGLRFDTPVTYQKAEDFLLNTYVAKYLSTPKGVALKRVPGGTYAMLQTHLRVPKSEGSPERVVYIRAFFAKEYMIVQEIQASPALAQADIVQSFLSNFEFHPARAHALFLKKEAVRQEQAAP